MMLDQNENSEQLALIKKKDGFDQPLTKQYLYYLNDLSPVSFHKNDKDNYTFYTEEKYGGMVLFKTTSYNVVLKTPYLRESFQKNGKKVTDRSEEHTSELQSRPHLVCRLLLEKKKKKTKYK